MGAVDDTRRVIQDFLAPELREIKARLDALEKRFEDSTKHVDLRFEQINQRFVDASKHVDQRFEQAEKRADERHQALLLSLTSIANYNEVRDRLLRLELQGTQSLAKTSEAAHQ